MKKLAVLACLTGLLYSCQSEKMETNSQVTNDQLKITWGLVTNMLEGENRFSAYLELSNHTNETFPASGWAIYFNQLVGVIDSTAVSSPVAIRQLAGELYQLKPTNSFQALAPGESLRIDYEGSNWVIKESGAPSGFYIVFENEDGTEQKPKLISQVERMPFTRPEQLKRAENDQIPMWTPEWQFEQNASLSKRSIENYNQIIPSPQSVTPGQSELVIDTSFIIRFHGELKNEALYLRNQLRTIFGESLSFGPAERGDNKSILITIDDFSTRGLPQKAGDQAYVLSISKNLGVKILATDQAGAFYGIQSLMALFPPQALLGKQETVTIPEATILDYPRYPYRGLHLDVARNFHKKESVLKLLDLMGGYKLNKLHFHLTDDEGWRLEIPEIPELTEIGAFRGHTYTEEDHLLPAYGSGPFPDTEASHGSGFYSKADFIEILKYANERHIEVIPEFDFPGHARAAIKSMEARYKKLLAQGDDLGAKRFLLHDPNDRSTYKSVQHFTDNVVCVCQESTYQFLEQVVQSTVSMYQEAGVPLLAIHIGGDEVPEGVWEKSPLCERMINQSAELNSNADLSYYFFKRVNEILATHQLIMAGWEEIALRKNNTGYETNRDFVSKNVRPYIWNNLWGFQDLSNRLANVGYPVVLCNVSNLYFDLAYNKDPQEPGLHWGGFVDTRKVFEFTPSDVFKSIKADNLGNPYDINTFYNEMENLTEEGRANILGIQGQVWSETIKGQEMLEAAVLPKLLGLSERAWSPQPAWEGGKDQASREKALNEAWNIFVNKVGQFAFPRLDYLSGGFHYRIPPPGVMVNAGQVQANVAYPGLDIRYTTDGQEPSLNSRLYNHPINSSGNIKFTAFNGAGRGSRTVSLKVE